MKKTIIMVCMTSVYTKIKIRDTAATTIGITQVFQQNHYTMKS